uniref:Matrix metallopeptidase 7 n=1 Tax=Callorhinchus milii TaxID=7868 RepID=A0A4W3H8W2_CALMI
MSHLKPPALLVLLSAVLCSALPRFITREQFSQYLSRFYNMNTGEATLSSNGNLLDGKIKEMQNFFGLQVTGSLNHQTLEMMEMPRCGYPDVEEYSHFPGRPRWPSNTITYRILSYTWELRREEVDQVISMAFKVWSDVTPLRFVRQTSGQADIMIMFASGYHGDYDSFDGRGGILAHAYAPGRGIGGDAHFDEDEQWTLSRYGINLFLVAAHEFGHALGLGHSSDRSALMFPTYQYVNVNGYRLPADDVRGIQSIYGNPQPTIPTKPQTTPSPPKNPNDKCDPNLSFDAVTSLRGEFWIFWRKHFRTRDVSSVSISYLIPNIPSIDAAVEFQDEDVIVLFRGSQYWKIRGFQMLPGFPQNILSLGFPISVTQIDAALYMRNENKALFFVGEQYWSYDVTTGYMEEGYPRRIADTFPGIDDKVESAFSFLYFSNGATQFKYDNREKQIIHVFRSNVWLNCK